DIPSDTFNVIDPDQITAWSYLGQYVKKHGGRRTRIPVPFWIPWMLAHLASTISRSIFGQRGKLPSLLMPRRLAVFKSLRFTSSKAASQLDWRPSLSFADAMARSFPALQHEAAEPNTARDQQSKGSQVPRRV